MPYEGQGMVQDKRVQVQRYIVPRNADELVTFVKTGVRKIALLDMTYEVPETLKPVGDLGIIQGLGESSIIKAKTGIGSVLSYEACKASATLRQKSCWLRDLTLDANGENICLEEWNLYHANIENVLLKNFAQYGIYGDGQSTATTGYSYWNKHRNIRVDTAACTAAVCLNKNYIDSFFDGIKGTANGVGFLVLGDGGHIVRDLWLFDVTSEIKLHALNDDIYNIAFLQPRIDTPTLDGIHFKCEGHSITRVHVKQPHWFNQPALTSNVYFEGENTKGIIRCTIDDPDDGNAASDLAVYNFEWNNLGTFDTTNRIQNNQLKAGSTAVLLNVPGGCLIP